MNGERWELRRYPCLHHKVFAFAQDAERKEVEELYDLEADIGERNNLAAMYPEKVRELKRLMDSLARE